MVSLLLHISQRTAGSSHLPPQEVSRPPEKATPMYGVAYAIYSKGPKFELLCF